MLADTIDTESLSDLEDICATERNVLSTQPGNKMTAGGFPTPTAQSDDKRPSSQAPLKLTACWEDAAFNYENLLEPGLSSFAEAAHPKQAGRSTARSASPSYALTTSRILCTSCMAIRVVCAAADRLTVRRVSCASLLV